MRRIQVLRALTAIVLALLVLLTAPMALATELTRGVSWDTAVEDMLTIEGIPGGETREGTVNGEFLHHSFLHFADTPHVTFMTYVFKSGELALYTESIYAAMQEANVVMTALYRERLSELMELYGGPTLQDKQPAIDAFAAAAETPLSEESIIVFTGWNLGDGTILYLMYVESEGSKCLYTAYVNEPRLLGTGE